MQRHLTKTKPRPLLHGTRALGRPPVVSPAHVPAPSRVSWHALSKLIDWSDRCQLHSGRPSVEQVPVLDIRPLRKLGVEGGVVLDLIAFDGPIAVTVTARGTYSETGGQLRLAWTRPQADGRPVVETLTVALRLVDPSFRVSPQYAMACPHCGCNMRQLCYAVTTFACRFCLGLIRENLNLGPRYTIAKRARIARAKLADASPAPITQVPIAVPPRRFQPLVAMPAGDQP